MLSIILNKLGKVDKTFFLVCIIIVLVIVAIYFLIPVINHKQYAERRENLQKREQAFRGNRAINQNVDESNINEENKEETITVENVLQSDKEDKNE